MLPAQPNAKECHKMIKNRKLIVILVVTCVAILAIWRITTFTIERAEYIKANQWKQDFEVTYMTLLNKPNPSAQCAQIRAVLY